MYQAFYLLNRNRHKQYYSGSGVSRKGQTTGDDESTLALKPETEGPGIPTKCTLVQQTSKFILSWHENRTLCSVMIFNWNLGISTQGKADIELIYVIRLIDEHSMMPA